MRTSSLLRINDNLKYELHQDIPNEAISELDTIGWNPIDPSKIVLTSDDHPILKISKGACIKANKNGTAEIYYVRKKEVAEEGSYLKETSQDFLQGKASVAAEVLRRIHPEIQPEAKLYYDKNQNQFYSAVKEAQNFTTWADFDKESIDKAGLFKGKPMQGVISINLAAYFIHEGDRNSGNWGFSETLNQYTAVIIDTEFAYNDHFFENNLEKLKNMLSSPIIYAINDDDDEDGCLVGFEIERYQLAEEWQRQCLNEKKDLFRIITIPSSDFEDIIEKFFPDPTEADKKNIVLLLKGHKTRQLSFALAALDLSEYRKLAQGIADKHELFVPINLQPLDNENFRLEFSAIPQLGYDPFSIYQINLSTDKLNIVHEHDRTCLHGDLDTIASWLKNLSVNVENKTFYSAIEKSLFLIDACRQENNKIEVFCSYILNKNEDPNKNLSVNHLKEAVTNLSNDHIFDLDHEIRYLNDYVAIINALLKTKGTIDSNTIKNALFANKQLRDKQYQPDKLVEIDTLVEDAYKKQINKLIKQNFILKNSNEGDNELTVSNLPKLIKNNSIYVADDEKKVILFYHALLEANNKIKIPEVQEIIETLKDYPILVIDNSEFMPSYNNFYCPLLNSDEEVIMLKGKEYQEIYEFRQFMNDFDKMSESTKSKDENKKYRQTFFHDNKNDSLKEIKKHDTNDEIEKPIKKIK